MTQKNRNVNRNDAGAAEVIGFIYIFGIVIISMSLILVMGYPMLQSSMDDSIFESAEQSFIILQTNMKMVAFDQVPVKTMSIQLQSSTLSINQNSNFTIDYTGAPQPLYGGGAIEFQKNDKFITYENGGIWKKYPSGNIMVSKPRIFSSKINGTTNITTIGIVSINGNSSMGGRGIAALNMEHPTDTSETPIITSTPVNVTININSPYAQEWGDYFNNSEFIAKVDTTNLSVIATRNDTLLVIGIHTVNVTII